MSGNALFLAKVMRDLAGVRGGLPLGTWNMQARSSLYVHVYSMTYTMSETSEGDTRVTRILEIVAKETGTDIALLQPDATLDSLGIESLDLTMAVFQLEETFDIEIPIVVETAGAEFSRVGDLVSRVIAILDKKVASTDETRSRASSE